MDSAANPVLSQDQQFIRVKEICQPLDLSKEQLLYIKRSLLSEIDKGLKTATNQQSSTKCWPTFLQEYPSGCEHGMFLVLEIRDHNFHISFMHMKGTPNYQYEMETHEIPKELYTESVEELFDFIVKNIKIFVIRHKLEREHLSMALCFPFPLRHANVKSAVVQSLGENFNVKNLVGKEVVELLQNAINRDQVLRINIETVVSNCTAILLANSWQGPQCHIGVNIGLGFSAAYLERVSEIEMSLEQTVSSNMIVNTEWADFGTNGHLDDVLTTFDKQADETSNNKGQRAYEKLVSSRYSGEVARQIILQCINEKILFGGNTSEYLKKPFSLTSRHVIDIITEEDTETFEHIRLKFDKMGISMPEVTECSKVHYILNTVAQRSALLAACGISSLCEKIAENHIVVGLGGSLYSMCPIYQSLLAENLYELLGNERTFELKSVENDVAVGSALSVAISKSREFVYYSEEMSKLSENSNF